MSAHSNASLRPLLAAFCLAFASACAAKGDQSASSDLPMPSPTDWRVLADWQNLDGWTEIYGNQGLVAAREGQLWLEMGTPLAGLRYDGELPSSGYELQLRAARSAGSDFFLGLSFPVGEGACTLILGGWGGALVGLSCIDGRDASQNETRSWHNFERDRDYELRLRVDEQEIVFWVDGEHWFTVARGQHIFSLRAEVQASAPLGLSSYATRARLGPLRMRLLNAAPDTSAR